MGKITSALTRKELNAACRFTECESRLRNITDAAAQRAIKDLPGKVSDGWIILKIFEFEREHPIGTAPNLRYFLNALLNDIKNGNHREI